MFQKSQNDASFLCNVYQLIGDEYADTYQIHRRKNQFVRTFMDRFYLDRLGHERTIENLQVRGYLSMEEFYQQYQVNESQMVEKEKEGFMKTFFRKEN